MRRDLAIIAFSIMCDYDADVSIFEDEGSKAGTSVAMSSRLAKAAEGTVLSLIR